MNKYSWLGIESFWFCELQFMWSSTHILYYFVFSWPELQFSKPHDEHGTSTSPTNNLWWGTEIISVKGRFHCVMYLFTMAVISFLTNSVVFKLFFREWIGLSTSMNRYLLHVHAGIQQKWPVVFLFSFWKHDMT